MLHRCVSVYLQYVLCVMNLLYKGCNDKNRSHTYTTQDNNNVRQTAATRTYKVCVFWNIFYRLYLVKSVYY